MAEFILIVENWMANVGGNAQPGHSTVLPQLPCLTKGVRKRKKQPHASLATSLSEPFPL